MLLLPLCLWDMLVLLVLLLLSSTPGTTASVTVNMMRAAVAVASVMLRHITELTMMSKTTRGTTVARAGNNVGMRAAT